MDYHSEYKRKLRSAEAAVGIVSSGDWIDYTMAHGMPVALDKALAARKDELHDIKVRGNVTLRPLAIVEADPQGEVFTYCSWHFSMYDRMLHDQDRCHYIPILYRNMPSIYEKYLDVDVAMISVCQMDGNGYFNFSLNNSASYAILKKAKTVIVEINEKLPGVIALNNGGIHISEVDYIVEGDNPELPHVESGEPGEADIKIAANIIQDMENGSCLQLGIGRLPNAVGNLIAQSDLKDLGMHTEMLVDGYLKIYNAGKLTNSNKKIDRNKAVWSFGIGSGALYEWVNNNPGVVSASVDYTNSPWIMARNEKLVSINSCIEIDLFGQACAESSGTRQISGSGGQLDFLTGSYLSQGGKGFICLTSRYYDSQEQRWKSRIVPSLPPGGIVTDPRSQAFYVVTEMGRVNLVGKSTWEIAESLISIAHPDFRDELIENAQKMRIWRRSKKR